MKTYIEEGCFENFPIQIQILYKNIYDYSIKHKHISCGPITLTLPNSNLDPSNSQFDRFSRQDPNWTTAKMLPKVLASIAFTWKAPQFGLRLNCWETSEPAGRPTKKSKRETEASKEWLVFIWDDC